MKKLISRRSFLQGTGIAAAAATLTACGKGKTPANADKPDGSNTDFSKVLEEFNAPAEALQDWSGKFDALIDQIRVEPDAVKREGLMHKAEDILMGTWALMPIYFYTNMYLQKEYVSNIYNNVFGMKRFYYAKNANNNNKCLNLNLASEPDFLDPALTTSVDAGCMACNMFLGLMNCDETGAIIPGCASDNPKVSEDGKVYTFTLRSGLKWSDGEKLDANDFLYSWNRVVNPNTASDYSYLFDVIAKNDDGTVNATVSDDGLTLTVNLVSPCPYFLDLCAFPTFFPVPKKYVEAANPDGNNPGAWTAEAGFVTNGAYTCTSWKHRESLTMTANPNFAFAADVTMPELNFMLSADTTAVYSAFTSGSLDFASAVPADEVKNLKGGKELKIDPYLGTYYTCCNVKSEVFNANRSLQQACALRKALCLQIDRDYIIETIAQGGQVPANCFVSDGAKDGHGGIFRANDSDYTFPVADALGYFDPAADNSDEITTLLRAAGLSVGEDGMVSSETPFSLEYLTNPGTHVSIAEAIQQDFKVLGIDMTIDTQEWKVFLATRKQGNYDIARNGWVMDFNDPINELEMWTSGSGNNDAQLGK